MVTKVISTKVESCSTLAKRHQRCQRSIAGVGSKTQPVLGAASGSPVSGLVIRGT